MAEQETQGITAKTAQSEAVQKCKKALIRRGRRGSVCAICASLHEVVISAMCWDKAFTYQNIIDEFPQENFTLRMLSYHKSHCTIHPDEHIKVTDGEFLDLLRDYAATLVKRGLEGKLIRFTDVKLISTAVTAVTKRADLTDAAAQQKAMFKIFEDAAKKLGES